MTAIVRVKIANRSPMYSSADGNVAEVSLAAAPWDTPYVRPVPKSQPQETEEERILAYVAANPGVSATRLYQGIRMKQTRFYAVLRRMVEAGQIIVAMPTGYGSAKLHYLPQDFPANGGVVRPGQGRPVRYAKENA